MPKGVSMSARAGEMSLPLPGYHRMFIFVTPSQSLMVMSFRGNQAPAPQKVRDALSRADETGNVTLKPDYLGRKAAPPARI